MTATISETDQRLWFHTIKENLGRQFPYYVPVKIEDGPVHVSPIETNPIFYGSYDWHSSVHSWWTLCKLYQLANQELQTEIRELFTNSFTVENIKQESLYLERHPGFECPYGLVWLLALCVEARKVFEIGDELHLWEKIASERVHQWLKKLSFPIRTGTHNQSAFAADLLLDYYEWADDTRLAEVRELIEYLYGSDRGYSFAFEPSGFDFLSPGLGALALLLRVTPVELRAERYLNMVDKSEGVMSLKPVTSVNLQDGHLAHLQGLNFSRAWMLADIALLSNADHSKGITTLAMAHFETGIKSLDHSAYAGSHWVLSFAMKASLELQQLEVHHG